MRIKDFNSFINESADNVPAVKEHLKSFIADSTGWEVDFEGGDSYSDEEGEHRKATTFINNSIQTAIDVDWTDVVTATRSEDLETEIVIRDVKYFMEDGNVEYQVVQDSELEELAKSAIDKAIKDNEKK